MGAAQNNLVSLLPDLVAGANPNEFTITLHDDCGQPHVYVTRRLNTTAARKLLPVVAELVAGISEVFGGGPGVALATVAATLAANGAADKFDKPLMATTSRDGANLGTPGAYERLASEGGMGEYVKLIGWLMQVNYAGVFAVGSEIGRALGALVPATATETTQGSNE